MDWTCSGVQESRLTDLTLKTSSKGMKGREEGRTNFGNVDAEIAVDAGATDA